MDDIALMRQKAKIQRRIDMAQILNEHPWYYDLLSKVKNARISGSNGSEFEILLMERIRRFVIVTNKYVMGVT
jgi:hypothetical protein